MPLFPDQTTPLQQKFCPLPPPPPPPVCRVRPHHSRISFTTRPMTEDESESISSAAPPDSATEHHDEHIEWSASRSTTANLNSLDALITVCDHLAGAVDAILLARVMQIDQSQNFSLYSGTTENRPTPLSPSSSSNPVPISGLGASTSSGLDKDASNRVTQPWNKRTVTFPGDPSHGRDMTVVDSSGNISKLRPKMETVIMTDRLDSTRQFPLLSLRPENASEEDPVIQLRCIFAAHELPRGPAFDSFIKSLQQRREVDTYLVPNEYKLVHRDQDVVFGITGTLRASCQVLKELLLYDSRLSAVPYSVHILVPRYADPSLLHSEPGHNWSAKHRTIAGTDESLLSIESLSIVSLMSAVRTIAETLCTQDEIFHYIFYQGGLPSIIPTKLEYDHAKRLSSHCNSGVTPSVSAPLSLSSPGKAISTLEPDLMQPFRLHLLLTFSQSSAIKEDEGILMRLLLATLGSKIRATTVWFMTDRDSFAACEISAHDVTVLERSIVEVVRWTAGSLGTWMVRIILPRDVMGKLHDPNQHDWRERELRGHIASVQSPPKALTNDKSTVCVIETLTRNPAWGIQVATRKILSLLFDNTRWNLFEQ